MKLKLLILLHAFLLFLLCVSVFLSSCSRPKAPASKEPTRTMNLEYDCQSAWDLFPSDKLGQRLDSELKTEFSLANTNVNMIRDNTTLTNDSIAWGELDEYINANYDTISPYNSYW